MKKYKRSFFKTNTFKVFGPAIVMLVAIFWLGGGLSPWDMVCNLIFDFHIAYAFIILVFILPFLFMGCIWTCFFIEMDDRTIIVKNYFLPFVRKRFSIDSISSCKIYFHAPAGVHYIQVKKKGSRNWGMFYGVDMIEKVDIDSILNRLDECGILVSDTNVK